MENQKIIIITGMHRSGTSLIASVLQNAGMSIGNRLMGGNSGNPRGHFEDLDFYSFHESHLSRNKKNFLVQDTKGLDEFTPDEIKKADELISNRSSLPIWGWKDPRTSLFLSFWVKRIPQATFIFLYRHPIRVINSLLRRAAVYPENDSLTGLISWCVYNQEILEFYKNNRDKCLLCNIDGVSNDFSNFIAIINNKFGVALNTQIDLSIFHSDELVCNKYDPVVLEEIWKIFPQPFQILNQFESIADIKTPNSQTIYLSSEKKYVDSINLDIKREVSSLKKLGLQLNYLFYLLDPKLANTSAINANSYLLKQNELLFKLTDIEKRNGTLQIKVSEKEQEVKSLAIKLLKNEQEGKSSATRMLELENEVQFLSSQIAEQNKLVQKQIDKISQSQNELILTKHEMLKYALSKSWRITRPFRKISLVMRGKKNA